MDWRNSLEYFNDTLLFLKKSLALTGDKLEKKSEKIEEEAVILGEEQWKQQIQHLTSVVVKCNDFFFFLFNKNSSKKTFLFFFQLFN